MKKPSKAKSATQGKKAEKFDIKDQIAKALKLTKDKQEKEFTSTK